MKKNIIGRRIGEPMGRDIRFLYGVADEWKGPENAREKTIEDIDKQLLTEWSVKLFLLMNLTWGYVETILDLCAQMRMEEVKKQSREIREQYRLYQQFRQKFFCSRDVMNESERGEWFEEIFSGDFDRLFNGIDNLARAVSKSEGQRVVCVAVHQAMTLIEAVKKYARHLDKEIRERGVWVCDYCMVQTEFLRMAEIVAKFPCGKDERFRELRELSARILYNRLKGMDVWEEGNGRVRMEARV